MVWKASLMSNVETILVWWKRWIFSSRVRMGYTGLIIALLSVCQGSRQMRTLAGFVAVPWRSRTTMLESQCVGSFTRTGWPVCLIRLSRASFMIGSFAAE